MARPLFKSRLRPCISRPERRRAVATRSVRGSVVEYSRLQKLVQVSVRQVLHHDRQWLPLSNDTEHLRHVGITDATQLLDCVVKRSSAVHTTANAGTEFKTV